MTKRTSVKATGQRMVRAAKAKALAERAATPGERQAAEAALDRMGATADDIAGGELLVEAGERKATALRTIQAARERKAAVRQQDASPPSEPTPPSAPPAASKR